MSAWHGWSRSPAPYTGETIHVGALPGRKQIALYTMDYRDGAVMYVHAYFRSEEEAQRFLDIMDRFTAHAQRAAKEGPCFCGTPKAARCPRHVL